MKKLFTLFAIITISTAVYAQIPNASFENWSGGNPVSWGTQNSLYSGDVTQSSNAKAGSYAAKINVVYGSGEYIGGQLFSGKTSSDAYFPITTKPATLTGWYILDSYQGDALIVVCGVECTGGSNTGAGEFDTDTSTTVYKQFSVTVNYSGQCTADSAAITFFIAPNSQTSNSSAIVDDLAFTSNSGIDDINKATAVLEPCTPNPANNIANIIYSIPGSASVSVALYDVMGHKIKTLLDNTNQSPGRYKIPTDVSNLGSGIYFYELTANGQTYTQKLAVTH